MQKALYYPVWVSTSGRVALRWGAPQDTPAAAAQIGHAEVKAGRASLSFVVELKDGAKTPLPGYTRPESARKIIMHWEALWDATAPDPQ